MSEICMTEFIEEEDEYKTFRCDKIFLVFPPSFYNNALLRSDILPQSSPLNHKDMVREVNRVRILNMQPIVLNMDTHYPECNTSVPHYSWFAYVEPFAKMTIDNMEYHYYVVNNVPEKAKHAGSHYVDDFIRSSHAGVIICHADHTFKDMETLMPKEWNDIAQDCYSTREGMDDDEIWFIATQLKHF